MILLKKIKLNNFLSHNETEISFEEDCKILLDGSSGAGKSSIFDAIIFALYGVGRVDNRSIIKKGAKMGSVSLFLKKDKESITITRTITSTGKHTLLVLVDKIAHPLTRLKELQEWIDKDLIGASYLLFINSVAYVQGNAESFVSQTAPKRKELLLEIIKAEDYDKYYENARRKLSELEADQSTASGQIIELEARLGSIGARIKDKDEYIKLIAINNSLIEQIKPLIQELEIKKSSFSVIDQKIESVTKNLNFAITDKESAEIALKTKLLKIEEKIVLQRSLSAAPEYKKELDTANKRLTELRKNLISASAIEQERNIFLGKKPIVHDSNFEEIQRKKRKINEIKSEPICPSGENCPYSGDHIGQIKKTENEISELEKLMSSEAMALAKWSIDLSNLPPATNMPLILNDIQKTELLIKGLEVSLNSLKIIENDIKAIEELEIEIPGLKEQIVQKVDHINTLKEAKDKAELESNKAEQEKVLGTLENKKREIDSLNTDINRATIALGAIDRDEKECKEISDKLSIIKKDSLNISTNIKKVQMIKEAFGSKGIETMVIDYLLPKLEDKINEVLSKLSDFRVRLDTQKKGADGESIVEGLFITILNESNEEMPFEAYSGGEKLKISVSISEALATLQKVGFRLFDETFLGLDENSTESFATVLEKLQKNFGQVLCISHLMQIKELFDKKILIKKNNGISTI